MTSNIGSDVIYNKTLGFEEPGSNPENSAYEELKTNLTGSLKKTFRPEFLNRVDDVVVFHALTREDVRKIADLLIIQTEKLLLSQGIKVTLTEAVREWLVKKGYDPQMGARPMRRQIQHEVENRISDLIISGGFASGDVVEISVENDKLSFGQPVKVENRVARKTK